MTRRTGMGMCCAPRAGHKKRKAHLMNGMTHAPPRLTNLPPLLPPTSKALAGLSVFERATTEFNAKYPAVAARGLGPSTKAERWNGRHAMVGAPSQSVYYPHPFLT